MRRLFGSAAIAALLLAAPVLAQNPAGDDAAPPVNEPVVRYDGHKLVRTQIRTMRDLRVMLAISGDHWTESVGIGPVDFRVAPEAMAALEDSGIEYRVMIEDVQVLIDAERERLIQPDGIAGGPFFNDFKTYTQINDYLDGLEAQAPAIAETFVVGNSLEGRAIRGIKITGPGGGDKPGVLYNGCQHAREWVAVMVPTYIADRLVNGYGSDPYITELVDSVEFYIVPIVNPDGYVYSWGPDRLWRKNRRNNGNGTFGVDLNRNWPVGWGGAGSDGNTNSETYRGTAPLSEPESNAMSQFVQAHPNILAHVDFHSYGQLILQPWGWTFDLPPDHFVLDDIGHEISQRIASVHGSSYIHGPAAPTLYQASGIFPDWSYGERNAVGLTIELRPIGAPGFILPPDQILPTAEEVFPGAMYLAEFASQPLQFDFVDGQPEVVAPNSMTPTTIGIDGFGEIDVDPDTARLFSRGGGEGGFVESTLTPLGNDEFEALLPGGPCGSSLEYYFQAETTEGLVVRAPGGAPDEFYVAMSMESVEVLDDNFENDLNWTAENVGASSGDWERGVPVDDNGWDYDPVSDSDGSGQAYLTENQNGNTDVDNGSVRLLTPTLDLTDEGDVLISYDYFLRLTNDNGDDRLLVEISGNGDAGPWTEIARHDTDGGLSWRSWSIDQAALDAAGVTRTANMKIRFTANDGGEQSINESGVDAFRASVVGCPNVPPCPGDANGDNVIGPADLAGLLEAWGPNPGSPADINGDGVVGPADLAALLETWGPCD